MSMNTNHNFALHKQMLRLTGVSLNESEPLWYYLYSFILLGVLGSYPVTVFHAILTENITLQDLLENIAYATAALNAYLKILATVCLRKELGKTLRVLEGNIYFSPNMERGGPKEETMMKECMYYLRAQVMVLFAMGIGNAFAAVAETLLPRMFSDPNYCILPYGQFALFNITSSPNFEAAFVYQVTTVYVITLGFVTVTTFVAGVMSFIAYQFKILQNVIGMVISHSWKKIKKPENSKDEQLNPSEMEWKYLNETLKEIVEYHSAIIKLAEDFEKQLNILALVDYLGLSLVICLALFSCTVVSTFNLRLINQLLLAAGNTFLQFITAYWGNQVITESEAVATACYEADFIGTDVRFQKSWIRIMERSQRKFEFTVGKFAPLSINTFQTVIQRAYSYFMVLLHFKQENKIGA